MKCKHICKTNKIQTNINLIWQIRLFCWIQIAVPILTMILIAVLLFLWFWHISTAGHSMWPHISYNCFYLNNWETFVHVVLSSIIGYGAKYRVYMLSWTLFCIYLPVISKVQLTVDQSLNFVQLFVTPWTATCQASLSFTISQSLLKLISIESVMPSNISFSVIPFSSCLQSFPTLGSFLMNQLFATGDQSTGVSASASVLPMNIQDWFPLILTDLMSLKFKELSRVFSNTTFGKHQFLSIQPLWSKSHIHTRLLEKP